MVFINTQFCCAQNLVPNPGFESYDTCPSQMGKIQYALNWMSFTKSPDYFNDCSNNLGTHNPEGFQPAFEGQAYAGELMCGPLSALNAREYFASKLDTRLVIGQKYYVSFRIALSDEVGGHNCACNGMGVRFTTFSINDPEGSTALINNSPQVYSSSIIDDSINWTLIKGSFVADSAYEYVCLGNFFDDSHTDTLHCVPGGAYYYFDLICVSSDSLSCGLDRVNNLEDNHLIIFPNPANTFLTIAGLLKTPSDIQIIDILGRISNVKIISSNNILINIIDFSDGFYFLKINFENNNLTKKIIIKH
jgi:hypothetical protein